MTSAPAGWLALLTALVAGCSESSPPTPAGGPGKGGGPPPVLVELGTAEAGSLTDGWRFLGQVESALAADLAAAVAGHVTSVTVREGDRVAAKQVLVSLDSAKIRAELDAAAAKEKGLVSELGLAKKQFERVASLDYPTVSPTEKERFELDVSRLDAQLATQRAEIRRLQVELARHTIRAPFTGVIASRAVDPGAWLAVGQTVVRLVATDDLQVQVDVSAELAGRISVGDEAKLLGAGTAQARIAGVVGALDSETRTMRVRLVTEERPAWLLAGMAVDVEFAVSLAGEGVLVPRDAVIRSPVGTRVLEYADGQGVSIPVEVLATARERALVRGEGLEAGDRVVVRGNERWRPGQPLRVAGPGEPPGPPPGESAEKPNSESPPAPAGKPAGGSTGKASGESPGGSPARSTSGEG